MIGYNPGYKRGRRFSSLEFQRLYDSDFFESHVLRQNPGADEAPFFVEITGRKSMTKDYYLPRSSLSIISSRKLHILSWFSHAASADRVALAGYAAMMKGKVLSYCGTLVKLANIGSRLLPRSISRKCARYMNKL